MIHYCFDVDGTLTPSRGKIASNFEKRFIDFCGTHWVSLVTGSDYAKTQEQLGEAINHVNYVFNCAGNSIRQNGKTVFESDWVLKQDILEFLESHLKNSKYPHRFGNHFEQRIGLLNYSVVGRGAVGHQRTEYYEWDKISKERDILVREINDMWPEVQAAAGGETGIDIFERGKDKSQILDILEGQVYFFGDRMDIDGNDYSLAKRILDTNRGVPFHVMDWQHTMKILEIL